VVIAPASTVTSTGGEAIRGEAFAANNVTVTTTGTTTTPASAFRP
jgi:hypothetical protein